MVKVIEGNLVLKENTVFWEDIKVNGDIVCEGGLWNIEAWDIQAGDIQAKDIEAGNIKAWDIDARKIKAGKIKAVNIKAWDINIGDTST